MNPRFRQPSAATRARKAANGGMNDTEVAYQANLRRIYGEEFPHQPFTLKLPGGVTYTPDFAIDMNDDQSYYLIFEVKGSRRTKPSKRFPMGQVVPVATEAAKLRLKVAAAAYPQHRFIMTWPNRGEWMEKEYSLPASAGGRV